MADALGIVATNAAEAGDPTAVVLVVWESERKKGKERARDGQTTPLKRVGSSLYSP